MEYRVVLIFPERQCLADFVAKENLKGNSEIVIDDCALEGLLTPEQLRNAVKSCGASVRIMALQKESRSESL